MAAATASDKAALALVCMEHEVGPRKSYRDPALTNDPRVLRNLLEVDEKYTPSMSYFLSQRDLKPFMREKLTNWMLEVTMEEELEEGIFPLAVNYLDRFLSISSRPIKRTQLQLLGSVCLFIASKFKGASPISCHHLVWFTDNSITQNELLEWELVVLQGLKWDLASLTPYDFLDHLFDRLPLRPDYLPCLRRHAATLIDMCTTDCNMAASPSSMIAASSILAAVNGHPSREIFPISDLLQILSDITSIDKELIRMCLDQIETLLKESIAKWHQNESSDGSSIADPKSVTGDGETLSSSASPGHQYAKQPNTPSDVGDIVLNDGVLNDGVHQAIIYSRHK